MAEYLPLTERAERRSHHEAMQRSAGLQPGDGTAYWHAWITHPLTGQEALIVNGDGDKEYFDAADLAALLSEAEADAADWFLNFEGDL